MPVQIHSASGATQSNENDFEVVLLFSLTGLTLSLYLFQAFAWLSYAGLDALSIRLFQLARQLRRSPYAHVHACGRTSDHCRELRDLFLPSAVNRRRSNICCKYSVAL
jgi:hypothetical protein